MAVVLSPQVQRRRHGWPGAHGPVERSADACGSHRWAGGRPGRWLGGSRHRGQRTALRLLRLCFTHHPLLCGVVSAGLARLERHDRCAQAATKDHTLLRSDAVQRGNGGQWSASAGTSEADSEWIVLESEEWWPVSNRACDDSCGRPPRGDCQGAPQRAVSPRCENIVRPSPRSSLSGWQRPTRRCAGGCWCDPLSGLPDRGGGRGSAVLLRRPLRAALRAAVAQVLRDTRGAGIGRGRAVCGVRSLRGEVRRRPRAAAGERALSRAETETAETERGGRERGVILVAMSR